MGSGLDGLSGVKANLSPAKLKLADIGLELSLLMFRNDFSFAIDVHYNQLVRSTVSNVSHTNKRCTTKQYKSAFRKSYFSPSL